MAATAAYAAEAAKRHGAQPWWYVTVAGIGHRADADGRSPTKFSTYAPLSSYTGVADFKSYLAEVPSYSSDVLHLADGSSTPGTCEFTIVDFSEEVSALLAYLSRGKPVTGTAGEYPTILNADLTRGATSMTVNSTAGLSANTMVFLDGEAVRISAITGATTANITRAQWNTHATEHYSGDPVRAAMNQPQGQLVEVYRNFVGLTSADEFLRWRGVVTSIRQTDDGMGWRIGAQSILALTAAEVCRRQGRFRTSVSGGEALDFPFTFAVAPDDDDFSGFPDTTQNIWIANTDSDGVVHAAKASASETPTYLRALADVNYSALGFADPAKWIEGLSKGTIVEVFPVAQDLSDVRFPGHDPFRVWLTWLLSRDGLGVVHATYDVLPTGNGLERISAPWVNVDAAEHLGDVLGIELPNLVYGLKGDGGFSLKEHAEKELFGPYRVIVATVDGVLTPVLVAPNPSWRTVNATEVTHDDIGEDTLPHQEPEVRDAIEHAVAKTGYDWRTGKPLVRQEAHLRKRASWVPHYGRTAEYELHGYRAGSARSIVKQALTAYIHMHGHIPLRMNLDLPDSLEHLLYTGVTISLATDHLVDASTGLREDTTHTFIVTSIAAEDGARLRVTLEGLGGTDRVASISPAIRIDNVISTAPNATFDAELDPAREFTADGVFTGYSADDDWFLGGGAAVGDAVAIVNGNGLTVRTSGLHITSITLTAGRYRFVLDGASAGMVANDYLTFDVYSATNTTTRQKLWAYFSNGGRLGSVDDPPYIYVA